MILNDEQIEQNLSPDDLEKYRALKDVIGCADNTVTRVLNSMLTVRYNAKIRKYDVGCSDAEFAKYVSTAKATGRLY